MKKYTLIILILFFTISKAQTFDEQLEKLALEMYSKLKIKKIKSVGVFPFFNIKKEKTKLSDYTNNQFYGFIIKDGLIPKVIDRSFIDELLDEHQLNNDGLIDPQTAKKFGMIIGLDAFITGKVFLYGTVIKVNLYAISPQTGEVYASVIDKLPIDYDLALFLNLENCEIENVGDYCFYNNTDDTYSINILGLSKLVEKEIILNPQTKSCFKGLKAQSYAYRILERKSRHILGAEKVKEFKGEFRVKTCESQLQKISATDKISANSNTQYFTIKINNPNYYSRKIEFTNNKNQHESIIVAANTNTSIELPVGHYQYVSKTTFTKVTVQSSNFNLNKNRQITLQADHKN
ncbi:MAG: CsgG/HfaB family protein [Flavobacteriaceae bacterium]|nr:CsgG/HfaB family protein [Flavobacteriaceae bacterium]